MLPSRVVLQENRAITLGAVDRELIAIRIMQEFISHQDVLRKGITQAISAWLWGRSSSLSPWFVAHAVLGDVHILIGESLSMLIALPHTSLDGARS